VYGAALTNVGESQARAAAFITLIIANLLLIVATRSRHESFLTIVARPNRVFWLLAIVAVAALLAVVHQPTVAAAFRFELPPLPWVAASVGAAAGAVAWIEIVKLFRRRRTAPAGGKTAAR
jgi:P-type Ca2+ transporter type 2C